MGFLLNIKIKQTNKNYPVGGKTGQLVRLDKAGQEQDSFKGNIDDELARDCKHKEIIKGANEEGNKKNTGGAN